MKSETERSNDRHSSARIRFTLVAVGSVLPLASLTLPWAHSGASAVPGYRIPSAVRLLSDAGLTGRWSLFFWAAVPAGAAGAWLVLWIRGAATRVHVIAGAVIVIGGGFFAVRGGVATGPLLSILGGIMIAPAGWSGGATKGRAR